MRRFVERALVGWVLALVAAPPAAAQIYESVGIRAQGMGGAFIAVADDASATWWNPAGIGPGAYFSALAEYNRAGDPTGGLRSAGIAAAFPALGLSYYRVRAAKQSVTVTFRPTETAPGDRQVDVGVNGDLSTRPIDQFGASAGQSIGDHLVVAATLKLLHGASQVRGDLDAGAMLLVGPAHVGLVVKNVINPQFGDGADAVSLPRQARAGLSLAVPPRGWLGETTVAVDIDLSKTATVYGESRHVAGGVETWMHGRRAGLRAGIAANTVGSTDVSGSAGVSVAVRPGLFAEGHLTGGDRLRRGWGIGSRVTF
jgi:hypothetical protein